MLRQLDLPGYGQAIAGLDWLTIDGLESESKEIHQLARSSNAAWQIDWPASHGQQDKQVAFLSKNESKKKPNCAALLLKAAIQESTYLSVLTLDDGLYWVFAMVDGMPAKRLDLVLDQHRALNAVRDFITTDASAKNLPVYTDQADMLMDIPYQMDLRAMSVEILGHTIQKQDFEQSAFRRYYPVSVPMIAALLLLCVATAGYVVYEAKAEAQKKAEAARVKTLALAKNLAKLQQDIDQAINMAKPIGVIQEYTQTVYQLPMMVAGWRLTEAVCKDSQCMLHFKSQPFGTWQAYIRDKPKDWPEPVLPNDIERIEQPIDVPQESFAPRKTQHLPLRNAISYELGNLAQIARTIGISLAIGNTWEPVAIASGPVAVEVPIPIGTSLVVKGPAHLLISFAKRLPPTTGIKEISLSNSDSDTTFTLTGEVYALP